MHKKLLVLSIVLAIGILGLSGCNKLFSDRVIKKPIEQSTTDQVDLAKSKTNSEVAIVEKKDGKTIQSEIKEILASSFGMRLSYREPMFSQKSVKSPDGTLTASIFNYHANHFIEVRNSADGSIRQYVNTDNMGVIEEIGDLSFSPDGKKLAYAIFSYGIARNDEVLNGSNLSYVYVIDLASGQQNPFYGATNKKSIDTVLGITGWAEAEGGQQEPTTIDKPFTEKNKPGTYPSIYIPYMY